MNDQIVDRYSVLFGNFDALKKTSQTNFASLFCDLLCFGPCAATHGTLFRGRVRRCGRL
jgi:hypothetical protein